MASPKRLLKQSTDIEIYLVSSDLQIYVHKSEEIIEWEKPNKTAGEGRRSSNVLFECYKKRVSGLCCSTVNITE